MIHPLRLAAAAEAEVGTIVAVEAVVAEEEEDTVETITTLLHPPSQKHPPNKALAGHQAASVPA